MTYVYHTPVLLAETVQFLRPHPAGIYVDGTVGSGGHAEAILNLLSEDGRLIGIDADRDAIEFASLRLSQFGNRVTLVHGNFRDMRSHLTNLGVHALNGVLLDLGVSSHQLDESSRGFSFHGDDRLDMRMDTRQELDARTVVNRYSEEALTQIFWEYGEVRQSRRLAQRIVRTRKERSIDTTRTLAELVRPVVGPRFLTKSLARVFQAIRIEVNKELENLEKSLRDSIELLQAGGRIVVLSYHSGEDRIVKKIFKEEAARISPSGSKLVPDKPRVPRLHILTKKAVVPSEAEIKMNPRARSAKLRASEKIG